MCLWKFGIKRNGLLEERFDLMEIEAGVLRPSPLPQTHRIVVRGVCIVRLQFRKTREPLYDFISMARRTIVGLGQEEIANRIRGTEICCSQKRFDCIFIVAARVQGDAKTDRRSRRIRETLRRLAEEVNCGLKRPMQKKLTGPVEEITLARILMSCNLKLIHRRHEIPILLFDLPQ